MSTITGEHYYITPDVRTFSVKTAYMFSGSIDITM